MTPQNGQVFCLALITIPVQPILRTLKLLIMTLSAVSGQNFFDGFLNLRTFFFSKGGNHIICVSYHSKLQPCSHTATAWYDIMSHLNTSYAISSHHLTSWCSIPCTLPKQFNHFFFGKQFSHCSWGRLTTVESKGKLPSERLASRSVFALASWWVGKSYGPFSVFWFWFECLWMEGLNLCGHEVRWGVYCFYFCSYFEFERYCDFLIRYQMVFIIHNITLRYTMLCVI